MSFTLILLALGAGFCFLLFGAGLSISAHRKVSELLKRVEQLERQLARYRESTQPTTQPQSSNSGMADPSISTHGRFPEQGAPAHHEAGASRQPQPKHDLQHTSPLSRGHIPFKARLADNTGKTIAFNTLSWWRALKRFLASFPTGDQSTNALFWLGGVVLTLGGLFLAKYTLEADLLSPVARVLLGFTVGIGLIGLAEYLTHKKARFHIHSDYLCAALVSAGVITCYAMTLVASHYYQLISAGLAFTALAVIALTTTAMALRYGPLVAVIGILGAYSVPVPFWHLDYSTLTLAAYVALVSMSATVVANHVQRRWLWWLSFVAHFSWFLAIVLLSSRGDAWIVVMLALFSLYLYVLSDILGWQLRYTHLRPLPLKVLLMPRKEQAGLLASLLPIWLFYFVYGYQPSLILATAIILACLCTAPLRHSAFDSWPLLGWLLSIATLLMLLPEVDYQDLDFIFTGAHLYSQVIAFTLFCYALYMQRCYPKRLAFSLLLVVGPSSLFALCYIFSPPQANLLMYSLWAVELALIAVVAEWFTARHHRGWVKLSGVLLANANISLILTMLLESSTLTLALSAQLIGLGYWCRRFNLSPPAWLVKILLAAVLIRLTLFPWLDSYSDELILGVHWTLVVYPLIIALLFFARRYYQDRLVRQIIAGAMMHVAALLLTTESSYQLVGRYPYFANPDFNEAVLLAQNWLLMAAVYCYRSRYSMSLRQVYLGFALLLTLGAGYYHAVLLLSGNPWFIPQAIGELPLWNWLLPLWLLPALIVLATSHLSLFHSKARLIMYGISALWLVQFVNGTIRHQFHHDMIWLGLPTEQLEMYVYSLVWLLISIVILVIAHRFNTPLIRQIGFAILAAVVCKAFLVDMSQLTGLYRALSFLGLGLSLLGIGWLFQRMKDSHSLGGWQPDT
ncbi:DUF2339 domain-containing protein [Vibrio sp. CAU 1672]|uniref:DUF2339 domain-containing protein n=1 Tax=Vibrio sp. CAU 1672 TaxID=3032594 RepID=UPI0023D9BFAA|nr:DUF2339 domain-containing protein [Vibrio sp. CAU 1672]MDF2153410.1 DUF2339 domain-containing protein [Vibrio sp. CAU 1672]